MSISITESAALKIIDIAKSEGFENKYLRIRILGAGCAGFSHDLSFEDTVNEFDELFEMHNVKICCDQLSYQYLEGCCIDWEDRATSSGFTFKNPNIKGTCGCGSSVSF